MTRGVLPRAGRAVEVVSRVESGVVLHEERQALLHRLAAGATAAEVLTSFTDTVDSLVIGMYRSAGRSDDHRLTEVSLQRCCLIALGGYGRRELFPHSDIDIMFLYESQSGPMAQALSTAVLHDLWDRGFQVGHSTRTVADCLELGLTDLTVRTSMMEARFLAGSADLFQDFQRRVVTRLMGTRTDAFIDAKVAERQREYNKFGDTVYLLEPNVKRSQGGLRDLHLLQWVALARHGVGTVNELADRGLLSRSDWAALTDARECLSRIRCLLHLHAGMAQDILSFDEQVWIAETQWPLREQPHLRAVEQFMQQYYRHSANLHDLGVRFVDRCRKASTWTRMTRWLPSARIEGAFIVEGAHLTVPVDARARVLSEPALLLHMFEVAQARQLRIDPHILDLIHQRMEEVETAAFDAPDVHHTFLRIVAGPGSIAATLATLHKVRVLEKIIPAFAAVRGLMQFNQYHKYTVDEHSLLAVSKAEACATDPGMLGTVYREIHRKDILHLAILLHDLGKGCEEDHSEVGRRLAEDLGARLGLSDEDRRTLTFLVHHHLLMAHTAFRRDPYDERVLRPFVRAVGTPEVLRKLLILTVADITAVGPGVMTKWKESLLLELYQRALVDVSGERPAAGHEPQLLAIVRDVQAAMQAQGLPLLDAAEVAQELSRFPDRYRHATSPARIAAHLTAIRGLEAGQVVVDSDYHDELGTCEYTVLTWNTLTTGLFSKIAGVLAAHGLRILDAQILTRGDDLVLDTFQVQDPDWIGAPSPARREEIARAIREVLAGTETVEALLARGGRLGADREVPGFRQKTEVQLDHETSDRCVIIDVFADDRQGLLYVITRSLVDLGLSVHAARISTRLDQVADVFYVTDAQTGATIDDPARRERIRATLTAKIDEFCAGAAEPPRLANG